MVKTRRPWRERYPSTIRIALWLGLFFAACLFLPVR